MEERRKRSRSAIEKKPEGKKEVGRRNRKAIENKLEEEKGE